jgi:hypothetical protein
VFVFIFIQLRLWLRQMAGEYDEAEESSVCHSKMIDKSALAVF